MYLNLENLTIFNKKKFEEKKVTIYEVELIGEIELTGNERLILNLPPKFAIEENLPEDEELAYAKTRMTIEKDEGIEIEVDEGKERELEKLEQHQGENI